MPRSKRFSARESRDSGGVGQVYPGRSTSRTFRPTSRCRDRPTAARSCASSPPCDAWPCLSLPYAVPTAIPRCDSGPPTFSESCTTPTLVPRSFLDFSTSTTRCRAWRFVPRARPLGSGEPVARFARVSTRMIASRTEPVAHAPRRSRPLPTPSFTAVAPALIDALVEARERRCAFGAEKALRSLTGQDWGGDARAWRSGGGRRARRFRGCLRLAASCAHLGRDLRA